ncbi:hypothetical protein NQ317_002683 [Molorchus minor]|uniref:CASP-like protein n=1 Tax=Molorchus minor TaxID=1323400 RepID=A0ABQ9JXP6_9CUCU|nr:hypothetical protein NQ317_002683 [Molorchus minor]
MLIRLLHIKTLIITWDFLRDKLLVGDPCHTENRLRVAQLSSFLRSITLMAAVAASVYACFRALKKLSFRAAILEPYE